MTEKELQKLRRQDLLELMLAQGQQMVELQGTLDATIEELEAIRETDERLKEKLNEKDAEMEATSERLKDKLNEKDAQIASTSGRLKDKLDEKDALIEKLKGRLDQKDAKIHELEQTMQAQQESRRIELEEAGSIAMAALRLNGVFDAAQQAVEQYLYNVRELCREKYGDLADLAEMPDVKPGQRIFVDLREPAPVQAAEEVYEPVPEQLTEEAVPEEKPALAEEVESVEEPEPVKKPKPIKKPEPAEEPEPVDEPAPAVEPEPVKKPKPATRPKYAAEPTPVKLPPLPTKTEILAKMGKGVGALADYLNRKSGEE